MPVTAPPTLSNATPSIIPSTAWTSIPVRWKPEGISRFKRVRGRLTGIRIENYRAFRGPFELVLPAGENALIYGENGAGKSSLFHSVRDFLEAAHRQFLEREKPEDTGKFRQLRIADNQHRPKAGEPLLELTFEHGSFLWDAAQDATRKGGPWDAILSATDKGKGFLDYRALLRVH